MTRIIGSGGGSSSSSSGLQEAADTLSSLAYARFIDLIGEGPIVGLVNGDFSIYLDGIPLRDTQGTPNYKPYTSRTTIGTVDQDPIPGFTGTSNEVSVGIKFTTTMGKIVRPVSDEDADSVRVTVAVNGLNKLDENKLGPTTVSYNIWVKVEGGSWVLGKAVTIDGKTSARYQKSDEINLSNLGPGPYQVAVERVTPDSTSVSLVNDTYWDSYAILNYEAFAYPNSALVALEIDGRYFNSVPERSYHVKGLLIRVPTNYDPVTRIYTGIWNGSWKIAWTNNPAWCYLDILTNPRYGLGKRISINQIDLSALYQIAQYCDEPIPTGLVANVFGGTKSSSFLSDGSLAAGVPLRTGPMEPRFTLNVVLNTKQDAYKVLSNLTSVFRGMAYWANSQTILTQDRPSAPSMQWTNANVVDGTFTYEGAARADRHTTVTVAWNDPDENFRQRFEYCEDREGIQRFGIRTTEIIAFGCTSRSQARRVGLWLLYTERLEPGFIKFRTGMDSAQVLPGDVGKILDIKKLGKPWGGRLFSATPSSVTLDRPLNLTPGTYTLTVMRLTGLPIEKTVNITNTGDYQVFTILAAFDTPPAAMSVWTLASQEVTPRLARVVTIAQANATEFDIQCTEYNPSKYDAIELGSAYHEYNYSFLSYDKVPLVTGLVVKENTYKIFATGDTHTEIDISWDLSTESLIRGYLVRIVAANGNAVTYPETREPVLTVSPATPDTYQVYVRQVNQLGIQGDDVSVTTVITGIDTTPPEDVTGFSQSNSSTGITFKWDLPVALDFKEIELQLGTSWNSNAVPLFVGRANTWTWVHPSIGLHTILAKYRDTSDNVSLNAIPLSFTVTPQDVTGWANIEGIPANIASLIGTEDILNADIVVGGVNLITNSTNFSLLTLSGETGNNPSDITATGLTDPLGTNSASRITFNGNVADYRFKHLTGLRIGANYVASIWQKRESGTNFCFSINNGVNWNASVGISSTSAIGVYQRLILPFTTTTGLADIVLGGHHVAGQLAQSVASVVIAFFQVEEGNTATQWSAAPADISAIINTAQATADSANAQLGIIANDSILDKGEKPSVILDWTTVSSEQASIDAQATAYGITTQLTNYNNALDTLAAYLNSITGGWSNTSTDSPINRTTFVNTWASLYTAKQILIDKIAAVAGTIANWATVVGADAVNQSILDAQTAATNAQNAATNAQATATNAISQLTTISDDSILSRDEKPAVLLDWTSVSGEVSSITSQAAAYGITNESSAYQAAIDALVVYLNSITGGWSNTSVDSPINRSTFINTWAAVYTAKQVLLDKIAAVAGTRANWATVSGADAVNAAIVAAATAAANAQLAASNAQVTANSAISELTTISSDSILSKGEKPAALLDWTALIGEQSSIAAQAVSYGITTELNAYNSSLDTLAAYLNSLTPSWSDASSDTPITRSTFINTWSAVYTAKQVLLDKISAVAGTLANWSGVTNKPLDQANLVFTSSFESFDLSTAPATWTSGTVVPVSGAAWTKSLFVTTRNTIENNRFILRAGETIFAAADLASRCPASLGFGIVCYSSSNSIISYLIILTIPAQGGFSRLYGSVVIPDGTVSGSSFLFLDQDSAAVGYGLADNLYLGRAEQGATVGANWATNVVGADTVNAQIISAQNDAAAANSALAIIANDNILSAGEKPAVILDWQAISNEESAYIAQALTLLITTEKDSYTTAINALAYYLGSLSPSWSDTNQNTPIIGITFRQKFAAVYTARAVLLNKMADVVNVNANAAQSTANTANTAAYNAQISANNAANDAYNAQLAANNAISQLSNIESDGVLTPVEKPTVIQDWTVIANEEAGILSNASYYSITTEANNYAATIVSLSNYLNTLTTPVHWDDVSGNTTLNGSALRSYFIAVYTSRQVLLNAISTTAKARLGALATLSQVAAPQIGTSAVTTTAIAPLAVTSDKIVDLRTANYTEDGSGNPTAGAKMASQGTAFKVANNNLQIGTVLFSDYWARLVQAVDGSASNGLFVWRGNNDATVRNGTPNINCLTVQARESFTTNSDFQHAYWTYVITPTTYRAFSDNLDAIFSIRVRLYTYSYSSSPFADVNFTAPSRCYDGSTGAVASGFQWGWRNNTAPLMEYPSPNQSYSGYMRCSLTNAYGSSSDIDFGPNPTRGNNLPTATITGQAAGSGTGGGSAGGGCPAPWVKVRLVSGAEVNASDLKNGSILAAVNDQTLNPIIKGGVVRHIETIWRQRYRLKLVNGEVTEWSEGHRFAVIDKGWMNIENIRLGDHIAGQSEAIVESILAVGEGQVVSFRVDGAGTYFAGGMLCHNLKVLGS